MPVINGISRGPNRVDQSAVQREACHRLCRKAIGWRRQAAEVFFVVVGIEVIKGDLASRVNIAWKLGSITALDKPLRSSLLHCRSSGESAFLRAPWLRGLGKGGAWTINYARHSSKPLRTAACAWGVNDASSPTFLLRALSTHRNLELAAGLRLARGARSMQSVTCCVTMPMSIVYRSTAQLRSRSRVPQTNSSNRCATRGVWSRRPRGLHNWQVSS